MVEMSYNDFDRYCHGCILKYQGKYVRVMGCGPTANPLGVQAHIMQENGMMQVIEALCGEFQPITERVGFINVDDGCAYMMRTPARKFHKGLHPAVMVVSTAHNLNVIQRDQLKKLNYFTAIVAALKREYPSLKEAVKDAVDRDAVVAFDKQFCINPKREIYYREKRVANLPRNSTKLEAIKFQKGCEHLEILLSGDYEKTVRTFAAQQG
jgi:hypothetical protein